MSSACQPSSSPESKTKRQSSSDVDLDPRIQIELEKLNSATEDINQMESLLDDASAKFHRLMEESMKRLKTMSTQLGSCIEKARPYYQAVDVATTMQMRCEQAAAQFSRANEIHQAAKETVARAETNFLSNQHQWEFDSAWQEMLNNAIIKVTEAEHLKAESGRAHQIQASLFHDAQKKVKQLEKRNSKDISKSRSYFEEKAKSEAALTKQKRLIAEYKAAVVHAKSQYAESLKRLEKISEEIHVKRRRSRSLSPRGNREPCDGAELEIESNSHLEEMNILKSKLENLSCSDDSNASAGRNGCSNENETVGS